jgi:acyl carrier protein
MQPFITLRKILQQKLNIESPALRPSTNIKKELDMSDWEWNYLLNSVEQAWKISLPLSETEEIVNVKHLLAVVKKQIPPAYAKAVKV